MRRFIAVLLVSLMVLGIAFANGSQEAVQSSGEWTPGGKSVTLIVPYGAGGSSDMMARIFTNEGAKYFKNGTVVVNNMPGGACAIGFTELITSKPDGLTIGNAATPVVVNTLTQKTPYVYYKELTPICKVGTSTFVVFVNAKSNIYSLEDLKNEILSRDVILACNQRGGNTHWEMEYFALKNGGDITSVIYDGGASSIAAVLGGHADVTVQAPNDGKEYVRSGDLRAIAVLDSKRLNDPVYKDTPTTVELGCDWLQNRGFQGYALPKSTDPAIVKYYEDAFKNACADAAVQQKIADLGFNLEFSGSEETLKFWYDQADYYSNVFSSLGDRLSD